MSKPKKRPSRRPVRSGAQSGLSPGTMVFIGEQKRDQGRIDVVDYDGDTFQELPDATVEQCSRFVNTGTVTWINVKGLHDVQRIAALGEQFKLHPLTLEDIVNTSQRLKTEEFQDYTFIVLKIMQFDDSSNEVRIEHLSLILGKNYVMSFMEDEGGIFDIVRERIRANKGRIREMLSDYLAYRLIDTVVDQYFLVMERIGDRIEVLDDQIMLDPSPDDIGKIHHLKRDVLSLRKVIWPLREEIGALAKSESPLLRAETKLYWRDLYDHTIQVIDMVETYRDLLSSMHDTYLSSISNRMNQIMKVLTIIATIFIPLTFITGVYGMNFKFMPELDWPSGYFLIWGVMLGIGLGLVVFFKRRKWM